MLAATRARMQVGTFAYRLTNQWVSPDWRANHIAIRLAIV